jgi:hypothetical protein
MNQYHWRIIISVVLTIGLLLLSRPILPPLPSSSMMSDLFWTNKAYPEAKFDIVVIGDSRIYRGVNPTIVEEEVASFGKMKAFNYGFSSAGLDTAFMDAGAVLLDPMSKHPVIILGITPSSLADENMVNEHHKQEIKRSAMERWQRRNINPYFSSFDPTLPSVIRNAYREVKEGYYQNYKLNGWIASDKIPRDVWGGYWHIEKAYPEAEFSLSIRKNLIAKVTEWEKRGIQVFGFRPPAAEHFEAFETKPEYFPEKAIIAQFEAAGGTWIEIVDRKNYQTYDGNHLEKKSAERLSSFIGKAIKNELNLQKESTYKLVSSFSSMQSFDKEIKSPWSITKTEELIDKNVFSGTKAHLVKPAAFSCTYIQPLDSLLHQNLYIRSSCWMKSKESKEDSKAVLVISVQDSTGTVLWKGQRFIEQTLDKKEWNRIMLSTPYLNNKEGCTLKIYVWNNSAVPLQIDDLKVEISEQ